MAGSWGTVRPVPSGAGDGGSELNETTITVAGNLVSDVEVRRTAKGEAMARFRLASTSSRYDRDRGHWVDGDTTYWNVTAWRRAAENASVSLAKGHPVVVFGRMRQRTVDRPVGEGGRTVSVTYHDIEALHFGQDLTRCRSVFQRSPIGPQSSELRSGQAGEADGPGRSDPGGAGSGSLPGEARPSGSVPVGEEGSAGEPARDRSRVA